MDHKAHLKKYDATSKVVYRTVADALNNLTNSRDVEWGHFLSTLNTGTKQITDSLWEEMDPVLSLTSVVPKKPIPGIITTPIFLNCTCSKEEAPALIRPSDEYPEMVAEESEKIKEAMMVHNELIDDVLLRLQTVVDERKGERQAKRARRTE